MNVEKYKITYEVSRMGEALLIVNPSSGDEKASALASVVEEKLKGLYNEVTIKYTEKGGDALTYAREAAQDHMEAVFVMGGDGTVSEAINGLAEQENRPDFSFIPMGTVNDLARALGISLNAEEAVSQLEQLEKKPLDIGKVNDHYFSNVVAIGTIPEAVQGVEPEQKTKLGPLAYFLEGTKALRDNAAYTFDMMIDGEHIKQESNLLLVALSNSVGGFESLLPDATTEDGYLHLVALKGKEVMNKLTIVPKIFTGEAVNDEKILYRKFKYGKIDTIENELIYSNVDGDEGDALPLEIKVLPQHLTVLVPRKK